MQKKKESQIGVRLDQDLKDRAEKQARSEHRRLSDVVRMLLEAWLKKSSRRAA